MATILDLLMALNRGDLPPLPDPAKPVGMPLPVGAPPVMTMPAGPPPDLPPTAPLPPQDLNLINQIAGAAPTPPAPLSRTQRIFNALAGFGAGFQGNGAQFLAQLQEPQREYQQQLERYQGRRTQGIEFATQKQQREQDRVQRQADAQADRAFQEYTRRANFTDRTAFEQVQQAHEMAKLRERERIADERQAVRDKAQQERDARLIARDFGKVGAKPEVARELGRYYSMLTDDISPKAAEFESAQARLADIRARRAALGGGTGGGIDRQTAKLVQEFNTARETLIRATASGQTKTQDQTRKRIDQLVRRLVGRPGVEAGYGAGQWPYLKVNGVLQGVGEGQTQQPTAQGQPIAINAADVQEFMRLSGIKDEKEALRQLQAAGGVLR